MSVIFEKAGWLIADTHFISNTAVINLCLLIYLNKIPVAICKGEERKTCLHDAFVCQTHQ